jgi:hypothetical protein
MVEKLFIISLNNANYSIGRHYVINMGRLIINSLKTRFVGYLHKKKIYIGVRFGHKIWAQTNWAKV